MVTAVEAECFPAAEAAGRADFERRIKTFPESFSLQKRWAESSALSMDA